jgi:hypothetical protein
MNNSTRLSGVQVCPEGHCITTTALQPQCSTKGRCWFFVETDPLFSEFAMGFLLTKPETRDCFGSRGFLNRIIPNLYS